jgi:hypothetical protein
MRGVFEEAADPDIEQFRQALDAALTDLPENQRTIVHLRLWQGWSIEEIAKLKSISRNTAASRYRYAISKLQATLQTSIRRHPMSESDFENLLSEQPYRELSPDQREAILATAFAEQATKPARNARGLLWDPKSLTLLTTWIVMALLKWSTPEVSMDFPMAVERAKNPEPLSPAILLASSTSSNRSSE